MDKYFVSKPELQESAVNLSSEAEAMMHMLNDKAQERGVNLSTHIDTDLPLLFGEQKIKQILSELLSNAIQFTPSGGMVSLNIAHCESGFWITVTDTGVGMDSTALATMMRNINSIVTEGETKHGLPLVNAIVQLHDGTLHIKSSKDQGTTVSVRLPHIRTMIPHPISGLLSAMEDLDKD